MVVGWTERSKTLVMGMCCVSLSQPVFEIQRNFLSPKCQSRGSSFCEAILFSPSLEALKVLYPWQPTHTRLSKQVNNYWLFWNCSQSKQVPGIDGKETAFIVGLLQPSLWSLLYPLPFPFSLHIPGQGLWLSPSLFILFFPLEHWFSNSSTHDNHLEGLSNAHC